MKNKTNDRIIKEKNSLSNWKTQNLDDIINILVNEIKT